MNDWLTRKYVRLALGHDARAQIYTTLAMLLENGVQLIAAVDKLYEVHSDNGKNPRSAAAIFLAEARIQIRDGKPLSTAFSRYIDQEEASIIQAGERSGHLRQAFRDAIDNIRRKKEITSAVRGGAAYPALLSVMVVVMLYIVATKLMPQLGKAIDLDTLSGPAWVLHFLSSSVINYGLLAGIAGGLTVAWVAWSLPRLTGKLRVKLDLLPPWSIYRASAGAAFMLNVAVMVQANIKLLDALQQLYETATPYMRERIGATIQGIQRGRNLGEALADSEFNFPSKEAVRLLLLLAGNSGFDKTLHNFSIEWADATVLRVKRIMKTFFYAALIALGGTAILIVSSTTEIQSAIEASNQR